ncbi:DUF4350 domain-containing protein [Nocardioides caldifontis]|uniref:DUF4350 domain-containing protein n=1 Tax=Nocardioides caldifontis TaxID=2588938 RepID=UPI0011DFDE1D|nr:DUF4350 domain-containing protein [Nocardioides caldifontis]
MSAPAAQGSRRGTVVLVVLLLAAGALVAVLAPGRAHPTDDLHPENPDPNGARAVAEVLDDQGVDVEVADDQEALVDAEVDGATTLVVTSTALLGTSTVETLREQAADAGEVVLVQPTPYLLAQWPLPARLVVIDASGRHDAACGDDLVGDLTLTVTEGWGYGSTGGAEGCFPTGDDAAFLLPDAGGVTVLGAGDVLANEEVTQTDNAALALRLLGGHERLVWYVPDPADLSAADEAPDTGVVPDGFVPALVVLALSTVALVLWRGRRLGPLVTEPLPVVVRSAETAESRGRLYRRVRDQRHAAEALRRGSRRRLTATLGLTRGTTPETLVRTLADRTGQPAERLHDVLVAREVRDDAALVRLARDLADLERMQETDPR